MIEEMKCDVCDGEGFYYDDIYDTDGDLKKLLRCCKKCAHTGKVNWIENVFGKKQILPRTNDFDTALFNQSIPADVWFVTHNLNNQYVNISVFNDDKIIMFPFNIQYVDKKFCIITFKYRVTGTALITRSRK